MAFTRILGVVPRFFRPPFGSYSTLLLEILAQVSFETLEETDKVEKDLGEEQEECVDLLLPPPFFRTQRGYTHVYLWDTDSQDADGATASVQSQLFDTVRPPFLFRLFDCR